MHTDADFLDKLLDDPADDTTRLVYADWLEEQADPETLAKADYLRLELDIRALPESSLRAAAGRVRLARRAITLPPDWLRVAGRPRLEGCPVRFRFACPKEWGGLAPTADPGVRFCAACQKNVHYCATADEATRLGRAGECVAVSLALVRRSGRSGHGIRVGAIQLTPEQLERLRDIAARPAPASPTPQDDEPRCGTPPRRPRGPRGPRRQSRARNRNIAAEDWDDE